MARAGDRVNSALGKHGYSQIKKIGEGSFGAAILVQDSSDRDRDSKAIVKMIDISRASKQERDDALKESQVLSRLRHPYIVRYRENFLEDGWLCIVMDYCEGGDLSARIKRAKETRKPFSEEQVLRWFTQAILALKYIHDLHILHRDLKSGNFFLSKSGNIKMGDFGIAKVLECTAACAQTQIGTPYYLSPEICQGKSYNWGSDIWSMGCILYEMAARKVPFDAPDLKTLIKRITSGSPPEIPNEYSAGLKALCRELLSRSPDDRPDAAEILKRPVVQEVVRRMLEEVKGEEEKSDSAAAPAASGASAAASRARESRNGTGGASRSQDAAGTYRKNDHVEFYSVTHKEWLPAVITNVDADGRVMLNVKPNVWLGLEVQSAKVRPKAEGGATGGASDEPAPRSGSARPPRGGDAPVASPARRSEERRPDDRRPDSCRRQPERQASQDGPALRRANSRDGLAGQGRDRSTPGRQASPRRELGGGGGAAVRGSTPQRGVGAMAAAGSPAAGARGSTPSRRSAGRMR